MQSKVCILRNLFWYQASFEDIFSQGLFQKTPTYPLFQHDAIYFQHDNDDEREGQYSLLFSSSS